MAIPNNAYDGTGRGPGERKRTAQYRSAAGWGQHNTTLTTCRVSTESIEGITRSNTRLEAALEANHSPHHLCMCSLPCDGAAVAVSGGLGVQKRPHDSGSDVFGVNRQEARRRCGLGEGTGLQLPTNRRTAPPKKVRVVGSGGLPQQRVQRVEVFGGSLLASVVPHLFRDAVCLVGVTRKEGVPPTRHGVRSDRRPSNDALGYRG